MASGVYRTANRDMSRLSRRIVTLMIVSGALLTVVSFTLNMDQGHIRAAIERVLSAAPSLFGGVEVRPR